MKTDPLMKTAPLMETTTLMKTAVAISNLARYSASPRPWVGAAIQTASGEIATGFTKGETHAEQDALNNLKKKRLSLKGATLFTILEPCLHKCCGAIISSGIQNVVIGVLDPDKNVSGKGVEALKKAGITVETGLMEEEISNHLEPYLFQRTHKRPFTVLKLALTLDGYIASSNTAKREWLTGKAARADGHKLRAESDAVIVGANTYENDKPKLTAREFTPEKIQGKTVKIIQPQPVVLANRNIKLKKLFTKLAGDPRDILNDFYQQQMIQVLIEGGGKTALAFHSAGLIDKYVFYYAPKFSANPKDAVKAFDFGVDVEHKAKAMSELTQDNEASKNSYLKFQSAAVLDGTDLKVTYKKKAYNNGVQ